MSEENRKEHLGRSRAALEAAGVAEMIDALQLAECVYRKNCVAEGEPSSVLDALQAALKTIGAAPSDDTRTAHRSAVEAGYADIASYVEKYGKDGAK